MKNIEINLTNKANILKIACKVCLYKFEVDKIYLGEEVECPFCKSIFKFLEDRIVILF